MDEFEGISPNVVKYNRFSLPITIYETKDPHVSEVNEVSITVRIFHLHFHKVVVKGKTDLQKGADCSSFVASIMRHFKSESSLI